jgi:hypothetical protein
MQYHIFSSDYSYDYLRWIELYKPLQDHKIAFDHDLKLDLIQANIIRDKDTALAYFFAAYTNYKTYKMQEIILKSNDPKYALLFAQNVMGADIQALQQLVIKSGDIKYICNFGCFVPGADQKLIENIIAKEGKAKQAHMMLKYVPGASVNQFRRIIMASRRPRYLFQLARLTSSRRAIAKIEDILIELKSFTYIRLMAKKIKLANVKKLEQAVLDFGNVKEIKKFARAVKNTKMRDLALLF